jgi:hypothetical protein
LAFLYVLSVPTESTYKKATAQFAITTRAKKAST